MIDLSGYDQVAPAYVGERRKLPVGGYVCKIVDVEVVASSRGTPMLVLFLDIAEGDFTGFFTDSTNSKRKFKDCRWDPNAIYRQNIFYPNDNRICGFFKGLATTIEKSNNGIDFKSSSFDERQLVGKLIGMLFLENEWYFDGKSGVNIKATIPKTVADIRTGNFSLPAPKNDTDSPGYNPDDVDVPF